MPEITPLSDVIQKLVEENPPGEGAASDDFTMYAYQMVFKNSDKLIFELDEKNGFSVFYLRAEDNQKLYIW